MQQVRKLIFVKRGNYVFLTSESNNFPEFKKINLRLSFGYIYFFYNLVRKISLIPIQKWEILQLLSRAVCKKILYTLVSKMNFYTLANEKRDFINDY